jgi:hypothetical protein
MKIALAHLGDTARRTVAILTWTFLSFLYISLVSQWLVISMRDKSFTHYIDQSIQIAATEDHPGRDVRAQLLMKAEDLTLPIHADGIDVTGIGKTLKATIHYQADISMPIVNQPVYRMSFKHDLAANSIHQ